MSLLSDAARGIRGERVPVWFMGQAGPYLPEHRHIVEKSGQLAASITPDITTELTAQPVTRHLVDAGILYSHPAIALHFAGIDLVETGDGLAVSAPLTSRSDVTALISRELDMSPLEDAVSMSARALDVPVVGYVASPLTLVTYLLDGKLSPDRVATRALMRSEPEMWHAVMEWAATIVADLAAAQVAGGASAVLVVEYAASALSMLNYEEKALPYTQRALNNLSVPTIHYGYGTSILLKLMASTSEVLGVDHTIRLDGVAKRIPTAPLQGNIDPAFLFAPRDILTAHVDDVIKAGTAAPAHILSLGHNVPPNTDPDILCHIVDHVAANA